MSEAGIEPARTCMYISAQRFFKAWFLVCAQTLPSPRWCKENIPWTRGERDTVCEQTTWFHDGETLRAKLCLRSMDGCTWVTLLNLHIFSHSHWVDRLLLTGEAKFFLAKPNLSLLRMHAFISCEMFRISPRKSAREIRPLWTKMKAKYFT
jgi:hypothetical protein